jgi:hypothetical protein
LLCSVKVLPCSPARTLTVGFLDLRYLYRTTLAFRRAQTTDPESGYSLNAPATVLRQSLARRTGHADPADPIGELAAALRTLAEALDREQATSIITYNATVEPHARAGARRNDRRPRRPVRRPAHPAAVEVLAVLYRNAPELTNETLQAQVQAQLGISRDRLGGC